MNIQELSVGDWVATDIAQLTVEGDDLTNAFVKQTQMPISIISLLGEDELVFAKIDDELMGGYGTIYLKAENTSPIPLTPEILKKNCFVEHKRFNETYEYTTLLGTTLRQCIVTKYNSKQFNTLTAREEDTKKEGNDLERLSKHLDLIIPEVCVHHLQYLFRKIHPNKEILL